MVSILQHSCRMVRNANPVDAQRNSHCCTRFEAQSPIDGTQRSTESCCCQTVLAQRQLLPRNLQPKVNRGCPAQFPQLPRGSKLKFNRCPAAPACYPVRNTQVPWTMTLSSAAPGAVARFGSQVQSMFSAAPAAVIRSEDQSKLRYCYTFPSCSSGSHTVQPQVQSPMLGAVHTGTFPSSDLSISTRHTDDGQRS